MELITRVGPYVVAALTLVLTIVTSAHVILFKRDARAAFAWVGLIWLAPLLGAALYVAFGINRIKRRATALRSGAYEAFSDLNTPPQWQTPAEHAGELAALARLLESVTRRPLLRGNALTPLLHGDEAYPEMLAAIDGARRSVALSTYIFDNDSAGVLFAEALGRAVARGVEVRVLIDDVGARYSLPPAPGLLRRHGVPVARFMRTFLPWSLPYINLRNHRKILVVDGRVGFTGGLNVREGHLLARNPRHPIHDLHFRVEGPVLAHMLCAFFQDWEFTTRERLAGPAWALDVAEVGPVLARGIQDGPDEDKDQLRWAVQGALACARRSVRIITPYFLPDASLITSLNLAALRGVEVDVVLPEANNLALVKWASTAQLWQILEQGCRVYLTPPPFDHTKLIVVDEEWTLLGSANLDPRSLRLNFELNLECYCPVLGARMEALAREKMARARPVSLADVDGRSLPARLRDGVARLFSPYL